jgi:hypothetical protein
MTTRLWQSSHSRYFESAGSSFLHLPQNFFNGCIAVFWDKTVPRSEIYLRIKPDIKANGGYVGFTE